MKKIIFILVLLCLIRALPLKAEEVGNGEETKQLIKMLKDKDSGNRAYAAWILGRKGEKAKEAIPFVIEKLKDEKSWVRANAAKAIRKIDKSNKNVIKDLIPLVKDADVRTRYEASISIVTIDPTIEQGYKTIDYARVWPHDLVNEDDVARACTAFLNSEETKAFSYKYCGGVSPRKICKTKEEFAEKPSTCRNFPPPEITPDYIEKIISELSSDDSGEQSQAAYEVATYPFYNEKVLDMLIKNLDSDKDWVKYNAAYAIGKIERIPDGKRDIIKSKLPKLIESGSYLVRNAAYLTFTGLIDETPCDIGKYVYIRRATDEQTKDPHDSFIFSQGGGEKIMREIQNDIVAKRFKYCHGK